MDVRMIRATRHLMVWQSKGKPSMTAARRHGLYPRQGEEARFRLQDMKGAHARVV